MAMAKSPPELVALYERLWPPVEAGIEHRKMFGAPCSFVGGQMFLGLYENSLFLRLSEEDRATFLALPGAGQFEPMAGRPMREYVTAPPAMLVDGEELRGWIDRSLRFAGSLPVKDKKPRATKKAKSAVA